MRCAFSFGRSDSGKFLVTVEIHSAPHPWLTIAAFPDENEFIQSCVSVVDDENALELLIAHVLLAAADRIAGSKWTRVDLSEVQLRAFGILNSPEMHDGHSRK